MKNLLTTILCVCFFTSCATIPPPRIENGLYINPKYEYSIKLPENWTQKEEIPDWLNNNVSSDTKNMIKIIFFNNDTNGMIIIANDDTIVDLQGINGKQLGNIFEKSLSREAEKIRKKPYVKNVSYTVYEPASIITPSLVSTTEAFIETEFAKMVIENNGYLYVCQEDDTCMLSISLISLSRTFDENKKVFEEVIKSLEKVI